MTGVPDLLGAIVAAARRIVEVRREREPAVALEKRAAAASPAGARFEQELGTEGRVNVIAECKRRSPSKGVLAMDYDPAAIARLYERGGAAAISVLTEPTFFDGALEHLEAVRGAVSLPLLRKDFIIDEYQLFEASAAGADAVLLIVAALGQADLVRLQARAWALGLAALVEVHDEEELTRAIDSGARVIGVNNRNLRTLHVDVEASYRLAARIPREVVAVSESGLQSSADLERLAAAGYRAFLIGERFMTDKDPAGAIKALIRSDRSGRSERSRRSAARFEPSERSARFERPERSERSDMFLKICGITRLPDALHAVEHGANALGFVFWPQSPRYITPARAAEIIAALPPGVDAVGVFVNEAVDDIRAVVAQTGINTVQLHGDETPVYADALGWPVLRAITLGQAEQASAAWPPKTTFLMDAADPVLRGGTGNTIDWHQAAAAACDRRIVLAGGLTPDNVADAIGTVRPCGVDVSSGVEDAPGVKNPDKVSRFLASARSAFGKL